MTNAVGSTYYYVTNYRGDVIRIVNGTGTLVASYSYDPWGKPISKSENTSVAGQPLRYASYVFDGETNLYYLKARYYDPETARFVSRDPIRGHVDPMSQNSYVYSVGDPVNLVDPSGNFAETALDAASIGLSAYDLYNNPSWGNAGYLAWDVAAAFIPFVPGSWTVKAEKSFLKMDLQFFAKKGDIQQIESIAKAFKMTPDQRRDFGDYVESLKDLVPNNKNFSYGELKEIAKEFLGVD